MRKERRVEREWRQQEAWKRRRKVNRERAMKERKCFVYRRFRYITYYCINGESSRREKSILVFSNEFEVLTSRVMNMREGSEEEVKKDRKTMLRKVRKIEGGKLLRKVMVKIGLK